MSELLIHRWVSFGVIALGVLTFASLFVLTAPYGRHLRGGWGPTLSNRAGWILMECPSVLLFVGIYLQGARRFELLPLAFLALWQLHYVHRTFIFPFRMRASGKRMPLTIAMMGFTFNVVNSYLNARWISELGHYDTSWVYDPRFIVGVAIFLVGFAINVHADTVLIHLRKPGETGYKIPRGGLYRFVSSPNYLGEILEWSGFALATYSLPGLAFAIYTFANLAPRAISNHRWYQEKFDDYPKERRALVPFLW